MAISEINALALLSQCRGDEIWSLEYARNAGVPEAWIELMVDRFESGFDRDTNKIYQAGTLVNQYEGIRDLDLAYQIGEHLGYDCSTIRMTVLDRRRQVHSIKQMIEED